MNRYRIVTASLVALPAWCGGVMTMLLVRDGVIHRDSFAAYAASLAVTAYTIYTFARD